MSRFFRKNWSFLCLAVVMTFGFVGLNNSAVLAGITIGSNGQSDVVNPPGMANEVSDTTLPIAVSWTGGDLANTSFISVTAPAGTKFTNVAASEIFFISGNSNSIDVTPFEGGTTVTLNDGGAGTPFTNFITSGNNMELKFIVSSVPDSGSLEIGGFGGAASIHLCPKDADIMNMTPDALGLKFKIVANGGFGGDNNPVNAGSVNFLNRPEIVSAEALSSLTVQVKLKSRVSGVAAGDFQVHNNKFNGAGTVTVTAASVDSVDPTKVNLTVASSPGLNFAENPAVSYTAKGVVDHKDDRAVAAKVDNDSLKMKTIRKFNTSRPDVSIDNTMVGINAEAVAESANKFTARIQSTDGQPLKLKLVCLDDNKMVAPMDLDNVSVKVLGKELTNEEGNADKDPADKDNGDPMEKNVDVLCIPGGDNDGDIEVDFVFGSFGNMSFLNEGDGDGLPLFVDPAPEMVKGEEKDIKLMVSAGGFMDDSKVGTDQFLADKKSPELITEGIDAPTQTDIESIKITFNEGLSDAQVEIESNWNLKCFTNTPTPVFIEDITIKEATLDTGPMTMVILQADNFLQNNVIYEIQVKAGTPTSVPGDKKFNPIICGTVTPAPFVTIGSITTGTDPSMFTKNSATQVVEGDQNIITEDNTNVLVTIDVDEVNEIPTDQFVLQWFVGDDTKPLGIDTTQPPITPTLTGDQLDSGTGVGSGALVEVVPGGIFKGTQDLSLSGNLADGTLVKLVCALLENVGDPLPTTAQEWIDLGAVGSGFIPVNLGGPTVESAMFIRTGFIEGGLGRKKTNQIMVWYSEDMNFRSLSLNPPLTVEEDNNGDIIGVTAVQREGGTSARHVIYTLDKTLNDDALETIVDHVPSPLMPSDQVGNIMDNADEIGIDKAVVTDDDFATTTTTLAPGVTTTTTLAVDTTTTSLPFETTTTTTFVPPTTTTTRPPTQQEINRELIRGVRPDIAAILDQFFPIDPDTGNSTPPLPFSVNR